MDTAIRDQWVEALLSGKYHQTKAVLRNESGYCCLGVLCDIVKPDSWLEGDENEDGVVVYMFTSYDGATQNTMPSDEILGEVDLDPAQADRLATMNDEGKSFAEIAAYIKAAL